MIIALMATLLPVPVEPAISRCGIPLRSAVTMRPLMSLPNAKVSLEREPRNSADSIFSRSQIISRSRFGTCMPTVDLPAMRSIRMLSAFNARQRSSVRLVMRLYLIPASGLNSKVVTTGPGLICVIWPWTSNSAYFSVSTCASSFSSSASIARCSSGRCSKLLGGSLKPPAMRGMVVFAVWLLSARSVTSGAAGDSSRDSGCCCSASPCSFAVIRSIPVLAGSGVRASDEPGLAASPAGTSSVVTIGLAARRFSSSLCIFLFARASCQSFHRSQRAMAKAKRVGAQTCSAANEKAVERYNATATIVAQTIYAPARLK